MAWSGGWRSGPPRAPTRSSSTWPARTELLTPGAMALTSPAQSAQHLRGDQPSKRRRAATKAVVEPKVCHPPLLHLHGQGCGSAGEQDRGQLGEVGLVSHQGQGGDLEVGLDHLDAFGGGAGHPASSSSSSAVRQARGNGLDRTTSTLMTMRRTPRAAFLNLASPSGVRGRSPSSGHRVGSLLNATACLTRYRSTATTLPAS